MINSSQYFSFIRGVSYPSDPPTSHPNFQKKRDTAVFILLMSGLDPFMTGDDCQKIGVFGDHLLLWQDSLSQLGAAAEVLEIISHLNLNLN